MALLPISQVDDAVSICSTHSGLLYHIVHVQQTTAAYKSPEGFRTVYSTCEVRSGGYFDIATDDVIGHRITHLF